MSVSATSVLRRRLGSDHLQQSPPLIMPTTRSASRRISPHQLSPSAIDLARSDLENVPAAANGTEFEDEGETAGEQESSIQVRFDMHPSVSPLIVVAGYL